MDWLLRRNFWLVKLMGVMTVMAIAANTVSTLLALWILSPSVAATPVEQDEEDEDAEEAEDGDAPATKTVMAKAGSPADERARRAERTAERILGYNPFCPTCSPADAQPPTEPDMSSVDLGEVDLAGAQRTSLPLVVAATMEAVDPTLSLATVVDVEHGIGGLFGVGDRLGPGVEIVGVTTGRVHIVNAGRLEYIPFDGTPPARPTTAQAPTKPKPAKDPEPKPSAAPPGAAEAIQCSESGSCVVDRAFVENLIQHPALLVGQGSAAPATTADGSPGFKLRAIRKGTLPDLLGLKSGDVITEVGGTPLTLDVLSGLYTKLRHASNIEVTVDRRGQRMSRRLEIRS